MTRTATVALAFLYGCSSDGDGTFSFGGPSGDTDVTGGTDYGGADASLPSRSPDERHSGDLSDGQSYDMDWAAAGDVACFTGAQLDDFSGRQVLYTLTQPAETDLWVSVDPDSGVDVSLYVIQFSNGEYALPPDIEYAHECTASASSPGGIEETVFMKGNAEYEVLVGVAGQDGAGDGDFEVSIWYEPWYD